MKVDDLQANIEAFFDHDTSTVTYIVYDRENGQAAIIDPVLDYDHASGRTQTLGVDKVIAFIRAKSLSVAWILETHAHADHLSSARYLKKMLGGQIAIGKRIGQVQSVFQKIFNLEPEFQVDGAQFDHLFDDDEVFQVGQLQAQALSVPGHTPADIAYRFGDAIFVGDTLFMPDVGTARCDFPGGDAHTLYRSIQRLLAFPDTTWLYMCHDYAPPGRPPRWQTTIRAQCDSNIHVHDGIAEDAFVKMREARDATLGMPALILPSIQVNIRAGNLPPQENNGISYLKIPLNAL